MDRDQLIGAIAALSAEDFAVFQRELRARRVDALKQRLDAMTTPELQARGQYLLDQMGLLGDETTAAGRRQMEHIDWINQLGDETDAADAGFQRQLARDIDRATDLLNAYSEEATAIFSILEGRAANATERDE